MKDGDHIPASDIRHKLLGLIVLVAGLAIIFFSQRWWQEPPPLLIYLKPNVTQIERILYGVLSIHTSKGYKLRDGISHIEKISTNGKTLSSTSLSVCMGEECKLSEDDRVFGSIRTEEMASEQQILKVSFRPGTFKMRKHIIGQILESPGVTGVGEDNYFH